ncbi:hypothetical protein ACFRQM_01330 [Streptomyces sp. NPDC056831]|uniref:hypothetical protein n=1 Tax=Streptomyces sp. NPDC056831 TaxID=3345954 RepID=UPI0036B46C8D
MANTTCREEFRTNTPHDAPSTSFPPTPVDGPGVVDNPVTHTHPSKTDRHMGGGVAGLGTHTCGVVVGQQLPQALGFFPKLSASLEQGRPH